MTYKQKTLTTLFGITAFFSWMYIEGNTKEHTEFKDFLHAQIPISTFMEGWDKPLIPYEISEKKSLCKEDPTCNKLAEAVVYEARSESLFGKYAVASVILNRADDPKRWPDTVYGVIHQGNGTQFEYLMNMHKQRKPTQADWDVARVVAFDLLNGIMERVTDANHYINPRVVKRMPGWTRAYPKVATIGNHDFHKWN